MPNEIEEPEAAVAGVTSHVADLARVTVALPVFAVTVDGLFATEPFCTTEKVSDAGEKAKAGATVTVRVTTMVAEAYPVAEAVMVPL